VGGSGCCAATGLGWLGAIAIPLHGQPLDELAIHPISVAPEKDPIAGREWEWQWVFPMQNRWRDRESGAQGRHHLDPSVV